MSDYGTANFVRLSKNDGPGALIYCAPEACGIEGDRIISFKVGSASLITQCFKIKRLTFLA